ncbi:tyrosine-type recombinase/integrase [Variovorax ureilyticus]|uniref:tyrosine-type recombinase/integrase n=1 Tax=Variovorax ureilyticus TaxID=1836198 RepID=UPI003D66ECFC
MANPAKPFPYRGRWRIQVTLKNGTRPFKDFDQHDLAKKWATKILAEANTEHGPVLGGPKVATLAQALDHYARQYSITKGGVDAELNRINHYLEAVNMPLLKAVRNDLGGREIAEHHRKALPDGWQRHNDARRAKRERTYTTIAQLAGKRCSAISPADIRRFSTAMQTEGLSDSTIQKEIAMLKVVFNTAIKEWSWSDFENPCNPIKLGKSERRFVALSEAQKQALSDALLECDNPYFLPLVAMAKESTLRKGTLLAMRWDQLDVANRNGMLKTKTGQQNYKMSLGVQQILANVPRHPSGKVFPLSANAVKMNWTRVRQRANLLALQFRDLRHLGATDWVRRGLGAHELKQVLGHTTIQTAEFYVDLAGGDMQEVLDAASKNGGVWQAPATTTNPEAGDRISAKRAERMAHVTEQRMAKRRGTQVSVEARADNPEAASTASAKTAETTRPHTGSTDPLHEERLHVIQAAWGVVPARDEPKASARDSLAPAQNSNVLAFRPRKRA